MAGSIEMGKATDWQTELFEKTHHDLNVLYLNPRRDDWDSSWTQSMDNPQFCEQVNWELDGLMYSEHQVFVFDPKTTSPITLMELGLVAREGDVIGVVCPEGFYRKGNVDIVCSRFGIPVFNDIDALVEKINFRFG